MKESTARLAESDSPSTPDVLLTIRDATKIYRMGEVDVTALRSASLDILTGEFLVIVGASGSGKSTLLNMIGGMDRPTSGEVLFRGRPLSRASDRKLTFFRRKEVGFVFQFYNLIPNLTAIENVEVATEMAKDPLDPMEALRMVSLTDRAGHFPSQMSGGQQQRVAIARAIASNPTILLCDEPTGALDVATSKEVLGLLVELNEKLGKTIVLITHNPSFTSVGHRVARMRDGTVVEVRSNETRLSVAEVSW